MLATPDHISRAPAHWHEVCWRKGSMRSDTTADRVRETLATVADYTVGTVIAMVRLTMANRPRTPAPRPGDHDYQRRSQVE